MSIRVLVADDHAAVRAGIVMILNGAEDIEVVGEAADGETAIAMATELRPDVVLMDIRMPRVDGIEATRRLNGIADVLILTTFDLDEYVFGALRAGAAGFLLKSADAHALLDGIRVVARGDGMISPAVTRKLISAFARTAPAERRRGHPRARGTRVEPRAPVAGESAGPRDGRARSRCATALRQGCGLASGGTR